MSIKLNKKQYLDNIRSISPEFYASYSDDELSSLLLQIDPSSKPYLSEPVTEEPPGLSPVSREDVQTQSFNAASESLNAFSLNPASDDYFFNVNPETTGLSDQSLDEDLKNLLYNFKHIYESTKVGATGMLVNQTIQERGEDYKPTLTDKFKEAIKVVNNLIDPNPIDTKDGKPELNKTKLLTKLAPPVGRGLALIQGVRDLFTASKSNDELVDWAEKIRKDSSKKMEDYVENDPVLKGYLEWSAKNPMSLKKIFTDVDYMHRGLATLIPSITASLSANIVGGPAASVSMMFAMEGGGEYTEAMSYMVDEMGMDPKEAMPIAANAGITYGIISGGIEYFQLNSLMKFVGIKEGASNIFTRRITDALLKNRKRAKVIPDGYSWKGVGAKAGEWLATDVEQGLQEGLQNSVQLMVSNAYTKYGAGTVGGMEKSEAVKNLFSDFYDAVSDPSTIESGLSSMAAFLPGAGKVLLPYKDKNKSLKLKIDETSGTVPLNDSTDGETITVNDTQAILRSIMPDGDSVESIELDNERVDTAAKNLELDLDNQDDVKNFIKGNLEGGRKSLEEAGIDPDKFIEAFNNSFDEDITEVLDAFDSQLEQDKTIDKQVDESAEIDDILDNNTPIQDETESYDAAKNENTNDVNNSVDTDDIDAINSDNIDDELNQIDADHLDPDNIDPDESNATNLNNLINNSQNDAAGAKPESGVAGINLQDQNETSIVPETMVYSGIPEDTNMPKGWGIKLVKIGDGTTIKVNIQEVPGKDISIEGSNRPFFIVKNKNNQYQVVDARTGKSVSDATKTQKAAIENATDKITNNPAEFKKFILKHEKDNANQFAGELSEQQKAEFDKMVENQMDDDVPNISGDPLDVVPDPGTVEAERAQMEEDRQKQIKDLKDKALKTTNKSELAKIFAEIQSLEKLGEDKDDDNNLNDILGENLQRVASQEKLQDNIQTAQLIINRLAKQYKNIVGEQLAKVFDKHGNEVAGKAIGMGAQWSEDKGGLDTPPHEYAHIYLDILSEAGNKVINDAIDFFAGQGMTKDEAKEHLATEMGKYYADTIQDRSVKGKLGKFLKRFWLETKKFFTPLQGQEFQDLVSMRFFDGKDASQIREGGALTEQYQKIKENSLAELEGFSIFNKAWNNVSKNAKKLGNRYQSGKVSLYDFNREMLNQIDEKYHSLYRRWVNNKFAGDKYLEWSRTEGGNPDNFLTFEETSGLIKEDFSEVAEGLANVNLDHNSIDIRNVGKLGIRTFRELGVVTTNTEAKDIFKAAIDAKDYEDFKTNKINKIINISDKVLKEKDRQLRQYYEAQNNKVLTNQEGGIGNQRINLTLNKDNGFLQIKGPVSNITGKANSAYERKMLAEWDLKLDKKGNTAVQLAWLSGEDLGTELDQFGNKQKYGQSYEFLNEKDLYNMQISLRNVGSNGAVPVFNRGDSDKMAFALITDSQVAKGKEAKRYWSIMVGRGIVSKEQANNFMGFNLTTGQKEKLGIKTQQDLEFYRAQEIARFEAIEAYMPGMLKEGDGAKILKRIKIPFTPVIRSEEMEDADVLLFDPSNVQFVKNGIVTEATHDVPDIGKKYIGDGGTPTSRTFFNKMATAMGLKEGSNTAKTVMYENSENGMGAFKHQHYAPTTNMEIWENYGKPGQKLIAKIDGNGDIYDVNGNYHDMLVTYDEAKVLSGGFQDNAGRGKSFKLKGTSIGLIKYAESPHSTAKHPMQWYNYIRDPQLRLKFKEIMIPRAKAKIEEAWNLIKDDAITSEQKILELLKRLEGEYPEGLAHSLVEKARLGAGQHPDMEGMLNVIIQTSILEKGMQLGDNPGTMSDLAPNLSGDLAEGEISIGESDADFIMKKYIEETGSKRPTLHAVNNWLKGRALKVLVSRSPIPYDGGATMMTVKRIHSRGGIAEMHANEVYRRFEGDNDGDKVQIELLPDEMVGIYERVTKNTELKGIKVSDHMKVKKKNFDLSNRADFYELSGALTYGTKAIGEIANVQSTYGQLQEIFVQAEIDGEVITIRDPDSKMQGKISMSDYLRVLLQAAVDNAEHLALKDAGYNMDRIRRALFEVKGRENGKTGITDKQWNILKPLVTQHTMPNQFRSGRKKDLSKHRLDTSVDASRDYLNYVENRYQTITEKVNKNLQIARSQNRSDEYGTINPNWIKFNRNTHVAEDIAILPAQVDNQMRQDNPELFDYRETIFKIPYKQQLLFHSSAINNLRPKIKRLVKHMADNTKNFKEEVQKGYKYTQEMGGDYFTNLMTEFKSLGPQAFEKNEKLLDFIEVHGTEFAKLSKAAKIAATIRFLEGFEKIAMDSNLDLENKLNTASLPPYGRSENMHSLLDPDVMQAYNQEYNLFMKGKKDAKAVRYDTLDTIIKEVCK